MNSLIKIAIALAVAAISTGNLPKVLYQLRKAQYQLIKESQASKWPKAMLHKKRTLH
jgi:hypothetical protein